MRTALSTILQTLTPEAAGVLKQSVAEAARRGHGQTTPLHVAATLLASPTGLLRQACVRSHPATSHPLQCRALELCFSVALDRLPSSNASTAASASSGSNGSSAAAGNSLPLGGSGAGGILGVLGFRPARAAPGTPFLPADRSLYLNPRLQQQQKQQQGSGGGGDAVGQQRGEAQKMLEILLRTRKRNPILVGDSQLEELMKEVLQKIEKGEVVDGPLRNVEVIPLEKQLTSSDRSQVLHRLQELANSIDVRFKYAAAATGGVILDLGDLKWLVDSPGGGLAVTSGHHEQQAVAEMGRALVSEMAKLLSRFTDGGSSRVWLVGRASSATYLRCQVNHPTMEVDWDLQAVPIAARAPLPGILSRAENNGAMGSSLDSLTHSERFPLVGAATLPARRPPSENPHASRHEMCPVCKDSYEHELANLVAKEFEKSSSKSTAETRQSLPPWLQIAKLSNGASKPTATQLQTKEQELMWKQTTEELLKRWTETCTRLHPHVRQPATTLEASNLCNSSLLLRQSAKTKLLPDRSSSPLWVSNYGGPTAVMAARPPSPPGSPVGTDLALGRAKPAEQSMEKSPRKPVAEPVGFIQDGFAAGNQREKTGASLDFDSFKRLFRGLAEKVSWQPEAATAVATTVMQCKSGAGKRRGAGRPRGDTWLLFSGPDKVGKKQMAAALSEMLVGCAPVTVCFGTPQADGDVSSRGKTVLDKVAESVRRDPFSVVVLENVDRADTLVVGSLRRAMERGRMADSHGREVALGNVIFILISDASPEEPDGPLQKLKQSEVKLLAAASSGWELELAVGETKKQPEKRRPDWLSEEDPSAGKPKRRPSLGLSLDLNLNPAAFAAEEDATDGSRNSSDLTTEHEQSECGRLPVLSGRPASLSAELVDAVDEAVTFKPVDFGELRRRVSETITRKFQATVGEGRSLCIDEEALDRVVGAVWFGAAPAAGFEEWADRVLVPGFRRLKGRAAEDGSAVVRLLPDKDGCTLLGGGMTAASLPGRVRVAVEKCGGGPERLKI
ncbi:hypothetical protein Taro_041090 [Colocasia esculenta]|uniref:Clp R domain-containing protein n=1 Tax=Colocasia esculenta TaxID=4460 RepID=A0A843WKM0_COLES|nr:hypothetical protein [Colocasia esculenta]